MENNIRILIIERYSESLADAKVIGNSHKTRNDLEVGLVLCQWHHKYTNRKKICAFIYGNANILNNTIVNLNRLRSNKAFRQVTPSYIPVSPTQDMTWEKSVILLELDGNNNFPSNSFFLSDLVPLEATANLYFLSEKVSQLLIILEQWASDIYCQPKMIHVSEFTKNIDIEKVKSYLPVPLASPRIDFGLKDIPSFPNPFQLFSLVKTLENAYVKADIGYVNGSLFLDSIIGTDPLIIIDWSIFSDNLPRCIDYSLLEIGLLLALVPPHEKDIWIYEWPSLVNALSEFPISDDKVSGRLLPSAISLIKPIREYWKNRSEKNDEISFWLSSVYAGLYFATDSNFEGSTRFAATLYSAICYERVLKILKPSFLDLQPTFIFWPGFNSWKTSKKNNVATTSGNVAILIGAGKFPLDGRIDQLPQAGADQYELAEFLSKHGYSVYLLMDDDFTVQRTLEIFSIIKEDISRSKERLLVCFCGHGVTVNDDYVLVTGNSTKETIALKGQSVINLISDIISLGFKDNFLIFNSCYSEQSFSSPFNSEVIMKSNENIVILTSSSKDQKSYILRDNPLSIFMETLLEGLSFCLDGSNKFSIFELIRYVTNNVNQRANRIGVNQNPRFLIQNLRHLFYLFD